MAGDQHWTAYGACARSSPDDLFVEGAAQRAAREVCAGCAVRVECLIDALDHRIGFGVWGGMTERERRALLRRYPDVVSWRERLEAEPALVPGADHYGDAFRPLRGAKHPERSREVVQGR